MHLGRAFSPSSLVSNGDRAFSEPWLYEEIQWTWRRDQVPHILPFVRTTLHKPSLTAHVRKVFLFGSFDTTYDVPARCVLGPIIPVAGFDFDQAAKVIEVAVTLSYAHQRKTDLRCGVTDAYVALMLSQLHQLNHLVLSLNFAIESKFLGNLFRSALYNSGSHRFSSSNCLRQVIYEPSHAGIWRGERSRDVLPSVFLPRLQSIVAGFDNPEMFARPRPIASQVEAMTLFLIREKPQFDIQGSLRGLNTFGRLTKLTIPSPFCSHSVRSTASGSKI